MTINPNPYPDPVDLIYNVSNKPVILLGSSHNLKATAFNARKKKLMHVLNEIVGERANIPPVAIQKIMETINLYLIKEYSRNKMKL